MDFDQLKRGMRVEVQIPKGGEPGMRWVRAIVAGFSRGGSRVHIDIEGFDDWGLALTKADVKARVRAITTNRTETK